jgi:hypothetical protein
MSKSREAIIVSKTYKSEVELKKDRQINNALGKQQNKIGLNKTNKRKKSVIKIIFVGIFIMICGIMIGYLAHPIFIHNGNNNENNRHSNNIKSNIDLIPLNITFPSNQPGEGRPVTINSTIKNNGYKNADNILVKFYGGCDQGSMYLGEDIITTISPNNSEIASITIGDCYMAVIYTIEVDPNNKIQEFNENNNIFKKDIRI